MAKFVKTALGEKIAEGAMAEIYAWGPGEVVKLCKPGVRWRTGRHEAQMTRAAFAAGLPAPEVLDEVTVDGRFGMVLPRLEGPTLMELSRTGAMSSEQVGAILASLYVSVHQTRAPAGVLSLRDWMGAALRLAGDRFPQHMVLGVLSLIERLPPGDGLCHGDLHAGNVIMTTEGPRLIDWAGALRAAGGYDLAWTQFVVSELIADVVDDPERARAVYAEVHAQYAQLSGISAPAVTSAIGHYLPVARVLALLSDVWPAQRQRLIGGVEAALRQEN